ncbi:MAG: alpha/beta fold hydrolase [Candidatus Thorarchaeota archaeon]
MKRDPLYFTIFILSILIASSFYLSWTVDRGMGELSVERVTIERAPGRPVDFLVYQPRVGVRLSQMPIVLTLHGLAGSKDGMYAFNIELARRNFTVVSVDLEGHGDSTLPFLLGDYAEMAQDAYSAVQYVQDNWDRVDSQNYSVLSHSLGFRVAIELTDMPVEPMAYAAVGDIGQMDLGEYVDFPGNLLIAIGEFDEMITAEDAVNALRAATGNSSAVAGVTYGSFENHTAYRLTLAPTDHVFEALDGMVISEAISWLIEGTQGEYQLEASLDPSSQIYFNKVIATFTGALFLLVSVVPLMLLVYSYVPEKMKPRKILLETQALSYKKTFAISSILGAVMITIFTATTAIGFHLENSGIAWPSSMFATGLLLFFVISTISLTVIMYVLMGKDETKKAFASVAVERLSFRAHFADFLKGFLIAGICILWFLFWLGITGLPEQMQPWILIALVKWPVGIRGINTVIVMAFAIPYLIVDAAWLRGLLMNEREWGGKQKEIKTVIFAFASKFAVSGLLAVIVVSGTTALGFIGGKMVLLGLLLLLTLVISLLTTILTAWTALKFQNTWPAIILSAFMLAIVVVSSIPLI